MQPGDSRGLEGSSAGAGEAAGPCSPSVSFSSRVDMRVLSPLRELVSAWGEQGQGVSMDSTRSVPLTPPARSHGPRSQELFLLKQDVGVSYLLWRRLSRGKGCFPAAIAKPLALEAFTVPQNSSQARTRCPSTWSLRHTELSRRTRY